ncbi:hypothetical protein GCM10010470_09160 [Saccharopolyspora taberi]|uniref:Uncharacterized protein n=1 Tax=Saccharopolyspora taberi TaxID=60895 RepID=A0ABN3V6B5_9PSEU
MKVYRKQMKDIVVGDVVAGDAKGWWRITKVDSWGSKSSVWLTGINTATGEIGNLWGNGQDYRDLAG